MDDRGRVAAAESLRVNYRTMMNCYDSRRVSRRMRQALAEFLDTSMIDDSGEEIETRKGGNRGC